MEENERKRIGLRVVELRKEANMTQAGLAEKIGIAPNHIYRIESGKYNVGFDTLQKVAEVFDLKIDFCK